MKLVSLYIENFGGLHRYSLDFREGLTVIQEPNGFGKSTLAEFIRAMFYGFPRKAKTLDKSRRRKYTPWQGGKFGGNLVFELDGTQYRIERTFGATPKGDSFNLIDLTANKKSTRFSEEIGMELFQLDADSFERSTYLPQLQDLGSLSTDNIQAKLGNLVEDRGDVGNFDRAMTALKAARSSFIPYRGNGGSVAEAQSQVSWLQEELERTVAEEITLKREEERITFLEQEMEESKQCREALRKKMDAASAAASVAVAHREHSRLLGEKQQLEADLEKLRSRYPKGLPKDAEIAEARQAASQRGILAAQQTKDQDDADAQAWLEENGSRFENRVPTARELENCRNQINQCLTLGAELENTGLSESEQARYEKLLALHQDGIFEEKRLDALNEANRDLTKMRHTLETIALSEEEKLQMDRLAGYFGVGIPEEETLVEHRRDLEKTEQLRIENGKLLEELAAQPKKGGVLAPVLAWVLAAAGFGAGAWLLTKQISAWVYGAFGIGAAAVIAGAVLLIRKIRMDRQIQNQEQVLRRGVETKELEIQALEQSVRSFVQRYTQTKPLTEALHEIRDHREDLLALSAKATQLRSNRERLAAEIEKLEGALRKALGQGDMDRAIQNLRRAADKFRDLEQEKEEARVKRDILEGKIAEKQDAVRAFLGVYLEVAGPEQFHSQLSELQRSSERYLRCRQQVEAWQQREEVHRQQVEACEKALNSFFENWALLRDTQVQEQLLGIRDDCRNREELSKELEESRRELEAFAETHREELETPVPEVQEDMAALRLEEYRLAEQAEECSGQLLEAKQKRSQILNRLSRIPALRDELETWQEKRSADRKKAEILDSTMDFLEKARQSLQNSYFGPVRESFRGYMERLLGERAEGILLAPDLQVQLERSGESRELGYFSTGQTDAVMLCMRFALVDALFPEVKPFVILDDPFVNLDDERTSHALKLLQELAQEKQILYLTCNSSRNV